MSSFSSRNFDSASSQTSQQSLYEESQFPAHERMMNIEGSCKIQGYQFLRINYHKAIPLGFFISISVVGLLFLKYSTRLRSMIFYNQVDKDEATHLYVRGSQGEEEIVRFCMDYFEYKKLEYKLENERPVPISYDLKANLRNIITDRYLARGLSWEEVARYEIFFGRNRHEVEFPTLLEYTVDGMIMPFCILQYIFCMAYILSGYFLYGLALIGLVILTTIINYLLLSRNYSMIKDSAEAESQVEVIRRGERVKIMNSELVPGDVYIPEGEVKCDAILIKGETSTDEANLTGDSSPTAKAALRYESQIYETFPWIYEGSTILEKSEDLRTVVVNTGFTTKKGRIMRRILSRETCEPRIYRTALIFLGINSILGLIAFGVFLGVPAAYGITVDAGYAAINFIDTMSAFIPSVLPIYFNLNYSFSLARLSCKNISGTQAEKTVAGADTRVFCFDKTGTITEAEVGLKRVYSIEDSLMSQDIKEELFDPRHESILHLLATCHAAREINGRLEGDEIDKEIFKFSRHKLRHQRPSGALAEVEDGQGATLEILKVNQFESKLQSMSVLVRDPSSRRLLAFVKGAPERISSHSLNKPEDFDATLHDLSIAGYRTLAIGCKEVPASQKGKYLAGGREIYEQDIQLLGLLAFENRVKGEAREAFRRMRESNIECKMITGDNIFVAIDTAVRCRILSGKKKVLVLEGKIQNQAEPEGGDFKAKVLDTTEKETTMKSVLIKKDDLQFQKLPIAIDNDFLELFPQLDLASITIFARIPPEGKVKVVAKIKQQFILEYQSRSWCSRWLGEDRPKVGMCGDGANDLLALKEADLSLGIQESDASYASSFSIRSLLDVDAVIRESKGNVSNIMQLFVYIASTSMGSKMFSIMLATNAADCSPYVRFYYNFTSILVFPLLFALSRPTPSPTKHVPNASLLSAFSQLLIFGNFFIISLTMIMCYVYFKTTAEFAPTARTTLTFEQQADTTGTDAALMIIFSPIWVWSSIAIYEGQPWKEKFYQNVSLLVVFVASGTASVVLALTTPLTAEAFGFTGISIEIAGVVMSITIGGVAIQQFYNAILHTTDLNKVVLD